MGDFDTDLRCVMRTCCDDKRIVVEFAHKDACRGQQWEQKKYSQDVEETPPLHRATPTLLGYPFQTPEGAPALQTLMISTATRVFFPI